MVRADDNAWAELAFCFGFAAMADDKQSSGAQGGVGPEDKAQFERRVANLDKRLGDLKSRDHAAAKASRDRSSQSRGMAYGLRMASELVAAVLVGGLIGYGLDHVLGTKPWLFLVMFIIGFAAGVRNVMRGFSRVQADIAKTTGGDIGRKAPDDVDD